MKALILLKDKSLRLSETPKPPIKPNEVLVKLKASALNHREIWIQKGLYPGMSLPCILGADGAGIVQQIGQKVDDEILGKEVIIYPAYHWGENENAPSKKFRVLGMPDPGTVAEYISLPFTNIFIKPAYLTWEQAAATPVAYLTAWRALVRHGQISSNSKVLITGIGGGVAQAGLSLALAFGAEVFVSSSSNEKIAQAIKNGAKDGVNYIDEEWHLQMKDKCNGIDIVLDSSPSSNLDNYLKFMNYGGKIVAYGSTGSPKTTISISKFFLRHIQFIGTAMGSPNDFNNLLLFMEKYRIVPLIHETFQFENSIDAIETLKTGNQNGKIVITH